jgi:hypothetical protein
LDWMNLTGSTGFAQPMYTPIVQEKNTIGVHDRKNGDTCRAF